MPLPGIKLTSVQLHLLWGTLIQDALPTELPRPRKMSEIAKVAEVGIDLFSRSAMALDLFHLWSVAIAEPPFRIRWPRPPTSCGSSSSRTPQPRDPGSRPRSSTWIPFAGRRSPSTPPTIRRLIKNYEIWFLVRPHLFMDRYLDFKVIFMRFYDN